jgi:hypothetical protein
VGILDRILARVDSRSNDARVDADGFVHAPDVTPNEVGRITREGWSGPLPEHGFHASAPAGWRRLLVEGFGLPPLVGGRAGDASGSPHHVGWDGGQDHSGHAPHVGEGGAGDGGYG